MKMIKGIIIGLFLFYGVFSVSAQDSLIVNLSIPSAEKGIIYYQYRVVNDTFYVIHVLFNPEKDNHPYNQLKRKYKIENFYLTELKKAVNNIDTVGVNVSPCRNLSNNELRPQFFIYYKYMDKLQNGYVMGVYRDKIFRIIDLFNSMSPMGTIIEYDREQLINREINCK